MHGITYDLVTLCAMFLAAGVEAAQQLLALLLPALREAGRGA